MDILLWIVFGLVVGIVAKLIMPGHDPGGIFLTIILMNRVKFPLSIALLSFAIAFAIVFYIRSQDGRFVAIRYDWPPAPVTYAGVALLAGAAIIGGGLAYLMIRSRKRSGSEVRQP